MKFLSTLVNSMKTHPLLWIGGGIAGVYLLSDDKKSESIKDIAIWSVPPDLANQKLWAPVHLFAPNGLRITKRAQEHPTRDNYILTEYDSNGNIWQSLRMYDYSTLGNPIRIGSHDYLEPFSGDFVGYSDWTAGIKSILKLVGTIVSFVPGVGTGVSFAISAGIALAEGQTLSDAVLSGVRAAVPGAPATTYAFDAGLALAKGNSLSEAALQAARKLAVDKFGDFGGKAFDIAIAVGHGQSIQKAAFRAVIDYIPNQNLKEFAERVESGQNVIEAAKAVGGPAAESAAKAEMRKYGVPV